MLTIRIYFVKNYYNIVSMVKQVEKYRVRESYKLGVLSKAGQKSRCSKIQEMVGVWLAISIFVFLQVKGEPDRVLLKDDQEMSGQIVKKNIRGIELKKEKETVKIEYNKIKRYFYGDNKSEWELIFDSLLTGNFSKAIIQLGELESISKRPMMKEDIKFYLALAYYNQKNYDSFFDSLESLIKDFPDSYYLYHIISFIVDLSESSEIGEIPVKLTRLANNIVMGGTKQKVQKDKLIEGVSRLIEGFVKERGGNIIEANEIYKEVTEKYNDNEVIFCAGQIFAIRGLIKDNKLDEAEKKLKELQENLIKTENYFFLKNSWSMLGDVYKKQADLNNEKRGKFLEQALYAYLNVYLFYIPGPEELPEIYAKSLYYGSLILSELSQTAKTEAQKTEWRNKSQSMRSELKQKYPNTIWAGKL
ncbi:MAG: tetratricopeptide repeat protein [Planctomycetota bacterium]